MKLSSETFLTMLGGSVKFFQPMVYGFYIHRYRDRTGVWGATAGPTQMQVQISPPFSVIRVQVLRGVKT